MKIIDIKKTPLNECISSAVEALGRGELVIYPTETCYGIGADATNRQAIEHLRAYKGNRQNKPFSIMVTDQTMAERFVTLTPVAQDLYDQYLPGELTVVSDARSQHIAPGGVSAEGSVAIRMPQVPLIQELVTTFGQPITATSANPSDEKQPYTVDDVLSVLSDEQKKLVGVVLDAGQLDSHLPTTIVDTRHNLIHVLRQGALQFDEKNIETTESPEQTQAWGQKLIQKYKSFWGKLPIIIALTGEMGAGKTHLTKGVGSGLGITEVITSPSYGLLHEYTFRAHGREVPFWHVDAWRIENPAELDFLQLEKLLTQKGVMVIEWAEQSSHLLQQWKNEAVILSLHITPQTSELARTIETHVHWPEEKK